jgi:hypothetical protein
VFGSARLLGSIDRAALDTAMDLDAKLEAISPPIFDGQDEPLSEKKDAFTKESFKVARSLRLAPRPPGVQSSRVGEDTVMFTPGDQNINGSSMGAAAALTRGRGIAMRYEVVIRGPNLERAISQFSKHVLGRTHAAELSDEV